MSAQRLTMSIAGFFILLSLGLGHYYGQIDLTKISWLWFITFVGLNLFQSGITGWCLMTNMLKKIGAK